MGEEVLHVTSLAGEPLRRHPSDAVMSPLRRADLRTTCVVGRNDKGCDQVNRCRSLRSRPAEPDYWPRYDRRGCTYSRHSHRRS
jgi:hypothetical protein